MTALDAVLRDALRARLLRRLGHAIRHDLNAPVHGLYLCLDLALRGIATLPDDDPARVQVEKAVAIGRMELARLERASRTLLVDAGILEDEETRFDLVELTRELTRNFTTEAAMRKVQFLVSLPEESVLVRSPRGEIGQAILACIVAALDQVGDGGCVEVEVSVDGDRVTVDVLGDMPAGEAAAASAGEYSPVAIALRIARQFVESRGGDILTEERWPARRRATRLRLPVERGSA